MITADRTKNSACDKSAEDRFGGDSTTEEERAGETEMDQARGETSFVTGQAFTNQEGQSDDAIRAIAMGRRAATAVTPKIL